MISKLVSCVLNREFEPRLGQANDYNIGIYCELCEQYKYELQKHLAFKA
jgi:hypothetical protein